MLADADLAARLEGEGVEHRDLRAAPERDEHERAVGQTTTE